MYRLNINMVIMKKNDIHFLQLTHLFSSYRFIVIMFIISS